MKITNDTDDMKRTMKTMRKKAEQVVFKE